MCVWGGEKKGSKTREKADEIQSKGLSVAHRILGNGVVGPPGSDPPPRLLWPEKEFSHCFATFEVLFMAAAAVKCQLVFA